MAYPAYRSERRLKRRRWLLIVLSLILIVVLIALLASRQTERRGTVEFFAAAETATGLHESGSRAFAETLGSVGLLTRQDLTRRLELIVESATAANEALRVEAPSVIGASFGTMTTATASWLQGAQGVHDVMVGIMDGDIVESAVPDLQRALDQLRVGDLAYQQFLDSLSAVPEGTELADFSPIEYINTKASDPLLYDATNLVLRIQAAYSLAPHRDVSVSGLMNPEPVGDRGGIPVVPFAESVAINAVIVNEGNEDEAAVAIDLEVLNVETNAVVTRSEVVDGLSAGASTTVLFENLDIKPDGLYQAKLTVTISDDIEPGNNVWKLVFIWNAES